MPECQRYRHAVVPVRVRNADIVLCASRFASASVRVHVVRKRVEWRPGRAVCRRKVTEPSDERSVAPRVLRGERESEIPFE